jgi:ATP-binding cassette subfamily G (WHITE) protein 2 (SNQ2)
LFFAIVIYFMAGLDRAAGSFFTFYLFIVLSQMCMTVFFRTLGTISRNLDAALRIACVIIVLLILTSGYLVPYGDQRPWIKWFYWLNPVRYAFSGLMINEFKSLTMTCEDAQLVPNGPGYSSLDNQVCTLAGAIAGSDQVSGRSYLEQTFGYQVNNLWLYAGIIIIFVIGLLILNVVLAELISHLPPEVRSQSAVQEQKRGQDDLEKAMHLPSPSTISTSSVPIHWTSLNYTVPLGRATTKKLLHDVSGRCEPGRLLALMGPSGAGKSTLLDVLAQRKRIGSVSGVIRLGGALLEPSLQHEIGYCEQLDVLDPYQTVREALEFSSLLRNHARTPPDERRMYVEEVMELLDLHTCAGRLIGEFPAGLSVDERKRVSIGIELVARPKILFLDEPTSGLDSQSALSIVKFLRKLADAGQPIICTIHQPSAALYHHFDDLLLLHKGRTVFAGPTEAVGQYFSINGFPAPENANIAEFMMQTLTRDDATSLTPEQWQESFNQYSRSKQTGAEQSHLVGVQMIALVCIPIFCIAHTD